MALTKNSIQCRTCGEVLVSRHLHDFKTCLCGNVSVDGGLDYAKRSWPEGDPENWFDELSEYVNEEIKEREPGVKKTDQVLTKSLAILNSIGSITAMKDAYDTWSEEEDIKDPRRVQVRKAIQATMRIDTKNSPHIFDLQQVALCALRAIRL